MVNSFRDLDVWNHGIRLARSVYTLASNFPNTEVYGICSQMQRAAVSVPTNIAEGHSRSSTKDFLRHISIARGSLAELETLLVLAEQLEYCKPNEAKEIALQCDAISRMLSGLRNSLKRRLNNNF
jgi:four helix bundle protein